MPKKIWLAKSTAVLSTGIMACFGLTGMAAAQSTITNTGANSINRIISSNDTSCYISNDNNIDVSTNNNQTAVSGDATSTENTGAYWQGWSDWNPVSWQTNNASFTDWWSNLMQWLAQRSDSSNWASTNDHLSWHPAGSNWQDAWSNWDPMLWQANGQSYGNWNAQLMAHLNGHSGKWMMTWTGDGNGSMNMGSVSTGNATNNYNANLSISVINGSGSGGSCGNTVTTGSSSGGNGGGTIGNTGSGSTNVVKHHNNNRGHVMAANTVRYGSGNSQGAFTGASYAARNTGYGGGATGNAGNAGHVSGSVGVSNNTGGSNSGKGGGAPCPPSQPSAPSSGTNGTISNTGYGSTNVVSSRTNNDTYVSNTNNVSYTSTNTQTAVTGNATSSQNTTVGSDGSGNANNNAGSGTSVGVKN